MSLEDYFGALSNARHIDECAPGTFCEGLECVTVGGSTPTPLPEGEPGRLEAATASRSTSLSLTPIRAAGRAALSDSALHRAVEHGSREVVGISGPVFAHPQRGIVSVSTSNTSHVTVSHDNVEALGWVPGSSSSVLSCRGGEALSVRSPARTTEEDGDHSAEQNSVSTLALLNRFLEERRQRASTEPPEVTPSAEALSTLGCAASTSSRFALDELREARLFPPITLAAVASAAHVAAYPTPEKYFTPLFVEAVHVRSETVAGILHRQRHNRHAAQDISNGFLGSRPPLEPLTSPPRHLPKVLDMPVHLRCDMCQKHDSLCNRCHRLWTDLQASYRHEIALHCYSTLDIHHRAPLAFLTSALGTGAFLHMMSLVDGPSLTLTPLPVTRELLTFLLQCADRAITPEVATRVRQKLESIRGYAAGGGSGKTLQWKVAHMACFFDHRDALSALWSRCAGGSRYEALVTSTDLHAVELLSLPLEPSLASLIATSSPLRAYLLLACVAECVAQGAANEMATQRLCQQLREMGCWARAMWSEAIVSFVRGKREHCAALCRSLLATLNATADLEREGRARDGRSTAPPPLPEPPTVSRAPSVAIPIHPQVPSREEKRHIVSEVPCLQAEHSGDQSSYSPAPSVAHVLALLKLAQRPSAVSADSSAFSIANSPRRPSLSCGHAVLSVVTVRRMPFALLRRILSFCEAPTLLEVHGATRMPLLRWVALARTKCLPLSESNRLLRVNRGYSQLLRELCESASLHVLSREEKEATPEPKSVADCACAEVAVAALVHPPFHPLRVTLLELEDFGTLRVTCTALGRSTVADDVAAEKAVTPAKQQLRGLFGRESSALLKSKFLVIKRVLRLCAPTSESDLANSSVSDWTRTEMHPWRIDATATLRWRQYVQHHPEAEALL